MSAPAGSTAALIAGLSDGGGVPVILRGDVGSGRSGVVAGAAAALGRELVEREAAQLAVEPPPGMQRAMFTPADELRAVAATCEASRTLLVVDHIDSALIDDRDSVLALMGWLAERVAVVGIADAGSALAIPAAWRVVEHGPADVVRWWQDRSTADVTASRPRSERALDL